VLSQLPMLQPKSNVATFMHAKLVLFTN